MSIIDTLAKLDWFEKLDALFRLGTPSHKLVVSRNIDLSGQQIEDMLKSYGVKIWDRGFTQDTLSFRVKRKQAGWAEYLLFRCGIPVLSKLFYQRNASYHAQPVKQLRQAIQRQKRRGSVEGIIDFLWN